MCAFFFRECDNCVLSRGNFQCRFLSVLSPLFSKLIQVCARPGPIGVPLETEESVTGVSLTTFPSDYKFKSLAVTEVSDAILVFGGGEGNIVQVGCPCMSIEKLRSKLLIVPPDSFSCLRTNHLSLFGPYHWTRDKTNTLMSYTFLVTESSSTRSPSPG